MSESAFEPMFGSREIICVAYPKCKDEVNSTRAERDFVLRHLLPAEGDHRGYNRGV